MQIKCIFDNCCNTVVALTRVDPDISPFPHIKYQYRCGEHLHQIESKFHGRFGIIERLDRDVIDSIRKKV